MEDEKMEEIRVEDSKMEDVKMGVAWADYKQLEAEKKKNAGTYLRWILEEFTVNKIDHRALLNVTLAVLPMDQRNIKKVEEKALKSSLVLTVVYFQTLRNPQATVYDFATNLALVMCKIEAKNELYSYRTEKIKNAFPKLERLLQKYTEYDKKKKLPTASQVHLTPVSLQATFPGTYSLDIHFRKDEKMVAKDLVTQIKDEVLQIDKKIPYVCNVNDKDEDFEVRLYDSKDCLLFASKAKIFSGFFAVDVEEELHIMHSHREMLIPLPKAPKESENYVKIDCKYFLTLSMVEQAIFRERVNLEAYSKKDESRKKSLKQAIISITTYFSHIDFDESCNLFIYMEKVDPKKQLKASKAQERSRGGCDCCVLF